MDKCSHDTPVEICVINGVKVWAGNINSPLYFVDSPNSLVLNLTGKKHKPDLPKGLEDCHYFLFQEIHLDVPDGSIPSVDPRFWTKIISYCTKKGMRDLLVHCEVGHGRTGTVLCALLMANLNKTMGESVEFVRRVFCQEAVETELQISYLRWLNNSVYKRVDDTKELLGSIANNILSGFALAKDLSLLEETEEVAELEDFL